MFPYYYYNNIGIYGARAIKKFPRSCWARHPLFPDPDTVDAIITGLFLFFC
jgi:hypothetical protein